MGLVPGLRSTTRRPSPLRIPHPRTTCCTPIRRRLQGGCKRDAGVRYAGVPSSPACQWRTCAGPEAALGSKALGGAFLCIVTLMAKFMGGSLRIATDATIARQDTHIHNEKEGPRVQRERMCQCHRMSHLAARTRGGARRNSVRAGGLLHAYSLHYWRKRNAESIR